MIYKRKLTEYRQQSVYYRSGAWKTCQFCTVFIIISENNMGT